MSAYWKVVWILFGIFMVANLAFLHRVPGLLGDEGSEGENVWELLRSETLVVKGERSYIGPFIDYIRVPFVEIFGYTPLALRVPMLLAACATFWLAASVLKRMFGETPALFALALGFFNPIYLTQARLGWAITLFPFFTFLILWLLLKHPRGVDGVDSSGVAQRGAFFLVGLLAGLALSNHILFLPTLVAIVVVSVVYVLLPASSAGSSPGFSSRLKGVLACWPGLVGFAAGFALQFWVLLNFREDQGDIATVAQSFSERAFDLPKLLPHVLSGSSYVASYTGMEFSSLWQWGISVAIIALVIAALFLGKQKKMAWVWFLGLVIQTLVLLYMIDRFSLRYFAAPVMGRWMLAGVGLAILIERFPILHLRGVKWGVVGVALGLTAWSGFVVLVPFLKTDGSTNDFSLGNRTDSAAAQVDTRPLVACLSGAGPVFSENVHIWNRLQFSSHQYSDLAVVPQDDSSHADWLVQYRDAKQPDPGERCPELAHFRVVDR